MHRDHGEITSGREWLGGIGATRYEAAFLVVNVALYYASAWLGLISALGKGKRHIIVAYFINYCFAVTQYPNFGRSRNSAETNIRITLYRRNRNWAETKMRVRAVAETPKESILQVSARKP